LDGQRGSEFEAEADDELEGYRPLSEMQGLFVTSSRKGNLVVGDVKEVQARESPAGSP
jgi:hypothetical protein